MGGMAVQAGAQIARRGLEVAAIAAQPAEVEIGLEQRRIALEGGLVGRERLVAAAQALARGAEVVPRAGVRRIQRHRAPEAIDRFGVATLLAAHVPKLEPGADVRGLLGQRRSSQSARLSVSRSALMGLLSCAARRSRSNERLLRHLAARSGRAAFTGADRLRRS